MEPADRDMYRAAIHGDLEAFELVIRNMSRPLFAIAFGALQNREEAEDVVQDAFVKAWKARWQVRNPEKFPAWIATIVRNRAHEGSSSETFEITPRGPSRPSQEATAWRAASLGMTSGRPFLLETFKHRKMSWRLCARRKSR